MAAPRYYTGKSGTTINDVCEEFALCWWRGNVLKYIARAGKKPGESELSDLCKARGYIDELIHRRQKSEGEGTDVGRQE